MTRALLVAGLLVLAGCSGLSVPAGDSGTDTATLTPVPVPERGTAAENGSAPPESELAPGLTADGVADPFALANAHRRVLANQSYTVHSETRLVGPNGTLRTVDRVLRVSAGGGRYLLVERSDSAPAYPVQSVAARLELWYAGGPALFRVGEQNVSYRRGTTVTLGGPVGDITGHDRLAGLYGGVDRWAVETRIGWRNAFFTLESQTPPDRGVLDVPVLVEEPRNASIRLVLRNDGRVDHYRVRYRATFDGQPVEVVRRVHYAGVGNTTVTEPDWVGEARDATAGPTVESSGTRDTDDLTGG
ncbi:hypothetical protein [Halorarius halobius]|uniref:hypothetical protein n=1 Tax=Halorarius halobius TaxID=2962671 RepID=UPI0020CF5BA3|nr:hypothetical protein [Halorarius halobius]